MHFEKNYRAYQRSLRRKEWKRWRSLMHDFRRRPEDVTQEQTKALEEFIERRRQRRILKAFGAFRFRDDWHYKQDRVGREPRR